MALIFLGLTECALCGKTLQEGEGVTSLPPIGDKHHPLFKYFDAGIHKQCLENWDKKEEVSAIIERERQRFINSDYFRDKISRYGRPKWLDEME